MLWSFAALAGFFSPSVKGYLWETCDGYPRSQNRGGGGPPRSHQEPGASGKPPPGGAIELLLRSWPEAPLAPAGFWAFLENPWKTLDFLPRNGWGPQAFAIPGNTAPVTLLTLPDWGTSITWPVCFTGQSKFLGARLVSLRSLADPGFGGFFFF